MQNGVTDPDTGIAYTTKVRVNHCHGFSTCDDCSLLQAQIALAKHHDEEEKYVQLLKQHHAEVSNDRDELARIARQCKISPNHVGYMIDAMDKHKLGVPTTEAHAKCLAKMPRIVQKLTGVQSFKDDSLLLFRTLPDVPTGGNLTMTIVTHLFSLPEVQQATDLYLNVDGASDNICYHVLYALAYLLRRASKAGWPLQRIHLLRFKACTYSHTLTLTPRLTMTLGCRWGTPTINSTGLLVCYPDTCTAAIALVPRAATSYRSLDSIRHVGICMRPPCIRL